MESNEAASRQCKFCDSKIGAHALLCPVCKSYQTSHCCRYCGSPISPKMGAQSLLCPVCKSYQTDRCCQYCGSSIPPKATICFVCKFNQKWWKNWLVYIGGAAAVVTVISSGLIYFISNIKEAYRTIAFTDKVKIVRFSNTGPPPTLFSNIGDGDEFLADIEISWGKGTDNHKFPLVVNMLIPKGAILPKDLGAELGTTFSHKNEAVWGRKYMATKDGSPSAIMDLMVSATHDDACFLNVFFDAENPHLVSTQIYLREIEGKKLVTVLGNGHLIYYSVQTGKKLELDFPVTAAVMRRQTEECRKIALDRGISEP